MVNGNYCGLKTGTCARPPLKRCSDEAPSGLCRNYSVLTCLFLSLLTRRLRGLNPSPNIWFTSSRSGKDSSSWKRKRKRLEERVAVGRWRGPDGEKDVCV
ncbi:hypothetical protein HN51_002581 [Arachis hypogaea]